MDREYFWVYSIHDIAKIFSMHIYMYIHVFADDLADEDEDTTEDVPGPLAKQLAPTKHKSTSLVLSDDDPFEDFVDRTTHIKHKRNSLLADDEASKQHAPIKHKKKKSLVLSEDDAFDSVDESPGLSSKPQHRVSKGKKLQLDAAIDYLREKNEKEIALRKEELDLKKRQLALDERKFELESQERKAMWQQMFLQQKKE